MEGGHRRIERLSNLAHRVGAHLAPQQRQQRFPNLAGRQAKHEAGKDHPVNLPCAPRIGAHDLDRAIAAGPRNAELDIPKLGQKMPPIVAIATIGSLIGLQLLKVAVHRRSHLIFDDLRQGLPAERAVALAPLQAIALHRLHDLKSHR